MPVGRSIAVFFIELIFVSASIFSITSYVFKDVLQKENVSTLIKENVAPQMIDERCNQECQRALQENITNNYDLCIQVCKDQLQNQTLDLDEYVDNIYSQQIYGFTLEELTNFLNTYFILFIIVTILSGIGLAYLAENPFSRLGHASVSISIPLLLLGLIPDFIIFPGETLFQTISSYIFEPMKSILTYGIVSLVSGIGLSIYGYFYGKKKEGKKKKSKK